MQREGRLVDMCAGQGLGAGGDHICVAPPVGRGRGGNWPVLLFSLPFPSWIVRLLTGNSRMPISMVLDILNHKNIRGNTTTLEGK